MKIATLNIGKDVIETYNNMWTGVESVYFNGRKVSSQFNWFVGIHHFEVPAPNGYDIDYYRVEFRFNWMTFGITTDVFLNEECILNMSNKGNTYKVDRRSVLPPVRDSRPPRGNWTKVTEREVSPCYREEDLV